jgi:alpha-L-arabinofuranosidase
MKTKSYVSLFLFFCVSLTLSFGQIVVDASAIVSNVSHHPIGMNMNYLMDGSYLTPSKTNKDALTNMGVKFLRYPGGEKSDNYFWSVSPWSSSSPHFTRTGSCEWPSGDSRFAQKDFATCQAAVLDFDEFMTMANAMNGEAVIVVPYDAAYKAASCGSIPVLNDLITHAKEWVRYANITKKYNIKYWMIGNESWNTSSYNGYCSASQYRDDVIKFSQAMKAIDPNIKIIANGNTMAWWSTVLPTAASYIDYLGVSNYPVWNYTAGYSYYRSNTPDLMGVVNTAINAINSYTSASDKARLKVITTEFNSIDYSGAWVSSNNLGHALTTFEIMGEQLKNPNVYFSCFWNTRWVNNATNPSDLFDALTKDGNFTTAGLAHSIWGKFLYNSMIATSGNTTTLRSFASFDSDNQKLLIYIINKDLTSQNSNITINGFTKSITGSLYQMSGTGPDDTAPTFQLKKSVSYTNNSISVTLAPVSITVLQLNSSTTLPVHFTDWKATQLNNQIELSWITTEEKNSNYFQIERSSNGIDFDSVGFVYALGNSTQEIQYDYSDKIYLNEMYFYRLKEVDKDKSSTYSSIISITFEGNHKAWVSNRSLDKLDIVFPMETSGILSITDVTGKVLYSLELQKQKSLDVSTETFTPGIYQITIMDENGVSEHLKTIKF